MTQTPSSTPYSVPADRAIAEFIIKKSRFIGWACPAADRAEALAWLEQARQEFPDARHHCWAYQIGPPHSPATAAMSDDGEPSGTAGKPILNVLQHKDIGNLMVVVIRYFGGVKLGAGGLVRAYSQAAQMAVDELTLTEYQSMLEENISCAYGDEQNIRQWLDQHEGRVLNAAYGEEVSLQLCFPERLNSQWQELLAQLERASN